MSDRPLLQCHILDTGHCLASEHHLIAGGRRRTIQCHSIVALLGHPQHGWLLWDAGYAPRLWDATVHLPFRLYRWVTPLRLDPTLAVVAQLARHGLQPADIRRIVISHFHADHVAGLRDFPLAELVASRSAYEDVAGRTGFRALCKAFVPALLPEDFERRALLLPEFSGEPLGGLGPVYDLFGDGSALLVALPGHARGQLGLLAMTTRGLLFFVADSCWLSASYRENRSPHRITHLIMDDPRAMKTTIDHLHHFWREHADVALVPSHCPEAFDRFVLPADGPTSPLAPVLGGEGLGVRGAGSLAESEPLTPNPSPLSTGARGE
jgi:glyoxylase-like metal-dependent hydrolase (beta-lactamase superfamily II)